MFIGAKNFTIADAGTTFTPSESLYLAKEGVSLKIDDVEVEVVGSETDSPIDRIITSSKIEVKAVLVEPPLEMLINGTVTINPI